MSPADSLCHALKKRTDQDPDYWAFTGNDKRSHGHALFSYPAMMVPQLQGVLLDDLLSVDHTVRLVYDPFAGSGTTLTESMRRGLDYIGTDLNPLAITIMKAKSRPLTAATLQSAVADVLDIAEKKKSSAPMPKFRGLEKWFDPQVASDLAALRYGVSQQIGRRSRNFLWVCLAETVRLVSNSRTSTFKLHTYAPDVLRSRALKTIETFKRIANANIAQMSQQRSELVSRGHLSAGQYAGSISVQHADVLDVESWPSPTVADVLMTSPPYGDNHTTVPYGQHAFLPLMWIERFDLPRGRAVDQLLRTPYRTDLASLGGRRPKNCNEIDRRLSAQSDALARTARLLAERPGDGLNRFLGFCADLDAAINVISTRLRPGAFQFWTLGDRRISGISVPTTRIVAELSQSRHIKEVTAITRRIPRNAKRMALRNDTVPTMASEDILVLQTPASTPADSIG